MPKKIVTTTGAAHRDDTSVAQLERELRANEDRWGAVMANPFMGITVLDHNHYFIMANSTYQNMVGYTNDELKKLTPLDITPAGEREINKAFFEELRRQALTLRTGQTAAAQRRQTDLDTALCF